MDRMKYVHAVRELNFHDNLMAHPGRTDIKVPILDVMVAESQRIPGLTNTLVQVPGQVFRLAALEMAMDTNEEGLVSVNYACFGRKLGFAQPDKPEAAVQAVRFVIQPLLAAKLLSKVQSFGNGETLLAWHGVHEGAYGNWYFSFARAGDFIENLEAGKVDL